MGMWDWVEQKAIELTTGRDLDQEHAAAAAQSRGNHDRAGLYGEQAKLAPDLPYGTDPATISSVDNWASMSHPQIKSIANALDSSSMHSNATAWGMQGSALESDFGTFRADMSTIVSTGWEGQAADAATASTSTYAQQAAAVGTAARYMGTKVTEAATGAEQTRSMVPEPVSFSVAEAVGTTIANPLVGGADIMKQKAAQSNAHAQAVQVMTSVYTPVYQQSDAGIPAFVAAPSSTTVPPALPPWGGDPVGPGNPGVPGTPPGPTPPGYVPPRYTPAGPNPSGSVSPNPSGTSGSGTNPPVGSPPFVPPGYPGGLATVPPAPGAGGYQPSDPSGPGGSWVPPAAPTGPAQTVSQGWNPPSAGSVGGSSGYGFGGSGAGAGSGAYGSGGAGTGAGGFGGGSFGGGGSYGGGSYGGAGGYGGSGSSVGRAGGGYGGGSYGSGSGGSGAGGFGSGGSGSGGSGGGSGGSGSGSSGTGGTTGAGGGTGAGGAGAGGTGAASGTAGAAGRSSTGGGMGGGRGAKGEEDYEHNTPSYLITDEHGSEIVGQLPMVSPAVIGE